MAEKQVSSAFFMTTQFLESGIIDSTKEVKTHKGVFISSHRKLDQCGHLCTVKFSIAGTGNVAHHFAEMLTGNGHTLIEVFGRDEAKAIELGEKFGAKVLQSLQDFSSDNDLVVIAVKDDAIQEVASSIPASLSVIHTSGMTSIRKLHHENAGVVWPLQSITKGKSIDYSAMPMLFEASNPEFADFLMRIFGAISNQMHSADENKRARVHLAAVFANNFVNQMFDVAADIMREEKLSFDILMPIIKEEIEKISVMTPHEAQTGPAVRDDMESIRKHLSILEKDPPSAEIYKQITNRILKDYHDKKL